MIEIFNGSWKLEDVKDSNKIFIFGDNDARIGKGGQAIIRGLSNAIGIRTKKGPSKRPAGYYNDSQFDENCKKIREDILMIKSEYLKGKTIVFSNGGYGTGLAMLKQKAPKTFNYLNFLLKEYFNFDNERGSITHRIPGNNDLSKGKYIKLYRNDDILQPTNNVDFRTENLKLGYYNTFDLIRNDKKISFTSDTKYNNGEILIIDYPNDRRAICKVIESYKLSDILNYKEGNSIWSVFEGFRDEFIDVSRETPETYQTTFQFIYTLDNSGKMTFRNDIFKEEIKKKVSSPGKDKTNVEKSHIKIKDDTMSVSNEDILKVLKDIQELLSDKKKVKKPKKSRVERIISNELNGDILSVERIDMTNTYKVSKDLHGTIYYHLVKVRRWKLTKVEMLFTSITPF